MNDDAPRGDDDDPDLRPLPWAEEQRLLGVGVRIERRPAERARHLPALAAATSALVRGATDPLADVVDARLATLRARLWRSPFYREHLRAHGGSPDDLTALADLAHFPTLDRDAFAAAWRELPAFAGDAADHGLHLATSSGSTGQALLVPRSGYDGVHMWAAIRFFVARLHVDLPARPRLVLVDTLPGGLEYSVRAPQLGDGRGALHRLSTLRPRALARLERARPAILSTDPAGLHWLCAHAAAVPRARLVLSSAQHLATSVRERATAALAAPIVNYLATTELGPVAWECLAEPGRFHPLHPDVHVESVDGQLAVTRLRDSPLPLLRYLTGDRAEVTGTAGDVCACGVRGRSIVGFTGRHPCAFVRPDGGEVDAWSLSWLFKDLPLARFELAQLAPERFQLTLGADPPLPPALLVTRLRRTLVRLGFSRPLVALVHADPGATAAAKPRPFVRRHPEAE